VAIATLLAALAPSLVAVAAEGSAPGAIRGTLIDANGAPMIGYRVVVTDADGVAHQSEPTGEDGKYEISGLTPGTYTYSILDQEGKSVPVRIPPVILESGTAVTQPIAIVPKQGGKKTAMAWWIGGGVAAIAALVIINNNNDDNESPSMTPSN